MSEEEDLQAAPDDQANLKLIVGLAAGTIFLIGGLLVACKEQNYKYALLGLLGSAVIIWTTASENAGTTLEILAGLVVGIGAIAGISQFVGG